MKYPKPLHQRAVAAYLLEFTRKHYLEREDVEPMGPVEYPAFAIIPWGVAVTYDDIRIDIDGVELHDGTIKETPEHAIYDWAIEQSDAYHSVGSGIRNFRTYVLAL